MTRMGAVADSSSPRKNRFEVIVQKHAKWERIRFRVLYDSGTRQSERLMSKRYQKIRPLLRYLPYFSEKGPIHN